MSFIGLIVGLMFSIYLVVSNIAITMGGRKVFSVVVDKVLPRLNEVLPFASDWVERGHRAELLRLYALADSLPNQVVVIKEPQILEEEERFSGPGSVSSRGDRSVIQRMLAEEMNFSDSDNSQDLSGEFWWSEPESSSFDSDSSSQGSSVEILSDPEFDGPMDLPCETCQSFLNTHFVCARRHKMLLERIMAEPGQRGFSDSAKYHIQQCCLTFYEGLDSIARK